MELSISEITISEICISLYWAILRHLTFRVRECDCERSESMPPNRDNDMGDPTDEFPMEMVYADL
jgi:hypothetical protein